MAEAVSEAIHYNPDTLVIEFPQVYATRYQKGNQDDILQLAGVVGALVHSIEAAVTILYRPREWKGQVPKDIHNARVLASLSPPEKAAIAECAPSLLNNVVDAIGIGRYFLSTISRKQTLHSEV